MQVMARTSRKKSWQTGRQRVSVNAALAIQRENVVNRLVRLRTEVGHPEKPGEPLPQDQAAARAGVTVRQWQRWESGESIPYARSLSAVADVFKFDVTEFYDGPAGREQVRTPDPFEETQLDRIERQLADQATRLERIELMLLGKADSMLVGGDILTDQLDRLEQALTGAISENAASETEDWKRIAQELVHGGPKAQPDSPPTPQRTAAVRKKRAAASRTR